MAQKSTKTVPGNDVEKNMSEVNLFRIKGDTVKDLEDGQNREGPVMILWLLMSLTTSAITPGAKFRRTALARPRGTNF